MFSTSIAIVVFAVSSFFLLAGLAYRCSNNYRLDNAVAGMFGKKVVVFANARGLLTLTAWAISGTYLFG